MEKHFHLSKPAYETFVSYMLNHPEHRVYEAHEHGVDPLNFPDIFFFEELVGEPEHTNILQRVLLNRGVITRPMVIDWLLEELEEEEHREEPELELEY